MAEGPPSRPRVAWEEHRTSQKSSSPRKPYEVSMVEPLQIDDSWLPVYAVAQATVDFIQAFASSPQQEKHQKMKFLKCISVLCRAAKQHNLSRGLDIFCHGYQLAEKIQVLLEEEPRDKMHTAVRQLAMRAIAALSSAGILLEGKQASLLQACFSSVFSLPPNDGIRGLGNYLYHATLTAMDKMLETLVLSTPARRVSEQLQSIFQMLLIFTDSERAEVRERAVGRISWLSCVLSRHSSLEACDHWDGEIHGPVTYRDIEIPVLGQLLGRLLLFRSSVDVTKRPASDALGYLSTFLKNQESRSRPEQKAQQLCWEHQTTSPQFLAPSRDTAFLISLALWERTDIVLVIIEAMTDHSIFDKEVAIKMLDEVMAAPDFWLTVPAILSYIHKNLEDINTAPARQSVESLLLLMAIWRPREAVSTMLKIAPPRDSTTLAMWEVMFSIPQVLEEIFNKLLRLSGITSARGLHSPRRQGACVHVPPMTSEGCPTPLVLFQYLEGLIAHSERAEMARKMLDFLPHMMEVFHSGSTDIKRTVLLLCRNMMGHLKKKEASPIAVQLAAELLPLFDHECSRMRAISISLFRELLGTVVGNDRRRMKKRVRRGLLPLFLHMHDEIIGVAQVSREALAAAELLKWKELRHLLQTQQTWRIAECLLARDRSRAEAYCRQSLPYLEDAQAALRETAVRFLGLAARPLRDQNPEMVSEICRALQNLVNDHEPSISSLAAQTILILGSPQKKPRSGRTL